MAGMPGQQPRGGPRHKTIDVFSAEGEKDPEYQRMVQDIQDMQHTQGWLFGRGAFDKTDLLYLRDVKEQERSKEVELRDNEAAQFASLRSKLDDHQAAAASTVRVAVKEKKDIKPLAKLLPVVKVAAPGKPAATTATASKEEDAPPAKKAKPSPSPHPSQPAASKAEASAGTSARNTSGEQPSSSGRSHSSKDGDGDGDGDQPGLLGLLGGYGSDSEGDSGGNSPAPHGNQTAPSGLKISAHRRGAQQHGTSVTSGGSGGLLPSAAELLGIGGEEGKGGLAGQQDGDGDSDQGSASESDS